MKLKLFGLLLIQFIYIAAKANLIGVTGKVIDATNKMTLPGATISIPDLKLTAATDANGNFTFKSLPSKGKLIVQVQYIGYKTLTQVVDMSLTAPLVFELQPTS